MISVIGCIGHDDLGRKPLDQCGGLRCIALLTCRQREAHRTTQASNGHMYFGAQAAARAADRLIFRPPFLAPAACWWARTMVESMIRYSKSGSSDIASNIRYQTPLMLHRLKRRNTLFQSPNASGRSRQGEPVRTIQSTPSTNIRLSRPVEPFWSGRPIIRGAIRSQATSLKTKQTLTPKADSPNEALNLICC